IIRSVNSTTLTGSALMFHFLILCGLELCCKRINMQKHYVRDGHRLHRAMARSTEMLLGVR
ncbi:MAG: hypothetical protein QXT35_07400, partial [Conexivisphaerales archaeon]